MSRAQTSIPPIPYRYLLNEPYTKFQRDILDPCWMQPGEGWKPCEMKFKGGGPMSYVFIMFPRGGYLPCRHFGVPTW